MIELIYIKVSPKVDLTKIMPRIGFEPAEDNLWKTLGQPSPARIGKDNTLYFTLLGTDLITPQDLANITSDLQALP